MTLPSLQRFVAFGLMAFDLTVAMPGVDAKPDFSSSELIPPSGIVVEGAVARFTLRLRNHGDEAAHRDSVTPKPPKAATTKGKANRQLATSDALLPALMKPIKPSDTRTTT